MDHHQRTAPTAKLPDHALIRLAAAAHPERTPSEHEDAARRIAAVSYVEDMRRIQRLELNEEIGAEVERLEIIPCRRCATEEK